MSLSQKLDSWLLTNLHYHGATWMYHHKWEPFYPKGSYHYWPPLTWNIRWILLRFKLVYPFIKHKYKK